MQMFFHFSIQKYFIFNQEIKKWNFVILQNKYYLKSLEIKNVYKLTCGFDFYKTFIFVNEKITFSNKLTFSL